ncbi:uncharacterized protein LOC131223814 isoform X2 [Magnolia sinica]|uniref:uncharacterized protein LOC131223814 isoform X2 n=1 Tax=Magnolia sinica TaxID=86752 RepID=UPI0026598B01|nr:uncharacterized protein LOC131223814 isoform X2 [Magnolia sinica]
MGDLQVWLLPQPNNILTDDSPSPSPSLSPSNNPRPLSIGADSWRWAEQATCEIICRIQPTVVSEQRRKAVVDYVQRLIRGVLGSEVKLVKCLVQNIVVDISFNQLGGLCALCFLEQVDRLIGKDHLFKRSIILIKAWCYYESRILGAHHGLISTYALETLVLYIFHLFHSSLHGPLAVLYRFLDYFSKFDWDNYCVSLNGPVAVSSLPEIVAETPENDGGDLLLSKEFLRNCVDKFSVSSRGLESNARSFPRKHLNIVDPLKENNNLGRSVSKGNFYRIRSAFTYGARKLGRILLLPGEGIVDELNKFFMNTLDRHGSGERPDVQDPVPSFRESKPYVVNGSGEKCTEDMPISGYLSCDSHGTMGEGTVDHHRVLYEEIDKIRISGPEKKHSMTGMQVGRQLPNHQAVGNDLQRSNKVAHASTLLGSDCSTEADFVSGSRLAGDAKELATNQVLGSRITNEMHKLSSPNSESGTLSFGMVRHAPHLYFNHSVLENGKIENGNPDQTKLMNSGIPDNKASSRIRAPGEEISTVSWLEPDGSKLARNNTFPSRTNHKTSSGVIAADHLLVPGLNAYPTEDPSPRNQSLATNNSENFLESSSRSMDSAGPSGSHEALNGLADLIGDYDSHLKSLLYGQQYYEYILCSPVIPVPPTSPSQFHNRHPWDVRRSPHVKRNMFTHMNANGVVTGPPFSSASGYYPVNPPLISGAYGVEEMPKPRGTGTYFPNTNHRSYRERPLLGRGRNTAPVTQLLRPRNNGRAVTPPDGSNLPEKGSQEPLPQTQLAQHPVFSGNGRGKPGPLDFISTHQTPRGFTHAIANGFTSPPERLEFGTFGSVQLGAPPLEQGRQLESGVLQHIQGSGQIFPTSAAPRSGSSVNQERAAQSYRLKDDEDFPPLSV